MTNISWPCLVSELLVKASRAEIARRTGAGASTLTSLLKGESKEPRHALGQSLIALHGELCGPRKGKQN